MQAPIQKKTRRFYNFAPYRLYVDGDLHRDGSPVPLPPKSLEVLVALVNRHGRVATKDELLREVWPDTFVEESSLTYQISQLRKTLGQRPGGRPYIETATKRGYRFAAAVTESWQDEGGDDAKPQVVDAQGAAQTMSNRRTRAALWAVAFASVLALGAYIGGRLNENASEAPLRKFALAPPIELRVDAGIHPNVAVSADGRRIAFVGSEGRHLWIHDLEHGLSRPLEGAEDADDPFWSPDGERIGYFSGPQILVAPAEGGPSTRIYKRQGTDDSGYVDGRLRGGSWSPEGDSIVFSEDGALYEVPAKGGQPKLLVDSDETGDSTSLLRWPQFLPASTGKRALLYTAGTERERKIIVHDLDSGESTTLQSGELPSYSPSGHILYQAGPHTYDLWALPFSADRFRPNGAPFPVKRNARFPMTTHDNSLVYLETVVGVQGDRLAWVDREGHVLERFPAAQEQMLNIELSPDDRRAAVAAWTEGNLDVWIYDLERNSKTRFTTHEKIDRDPVWSPDGTQLVFSSNRAGSFDVYVAPADGSQAPLALLQAADAHERPTDWASNPDVMICRRADDTGSTLNVVPVLNGGKQSPVEPVPLVENAALGRLSPDGKHVAYRSGRSGRSEVFVRSFPSGEDRIQISTNGGSQPRWSGNGKELFYVQDSSLMAVPFSRSDRPRAGTPRKLFSFPGLAASVPATSAGVVAFDVSSDGNRFLVRARLTGADSTIRVVQNWFAEFNNQQ